MNKFRKFLISYLCALALLVGGWAYSALEAWCMLASSSVGDHGATLDEYIENARGLDYETLALFDSFGIKCFETTVYDHNHVPYQLSRISEAQLVSLWSFIKIHNHPIDAPFSITDLTNEHFIGGCEMVVSSEHVYILEAPNGWPTQKEIDDYFTAVLQDDDAGRRSDEPFFKRVPTEQGGGIITTNALLEDFSDRFGLIYTVMTVDEWRTR